MVSYKQRLDNLKSFLSEQKNKERECNHEDGNHEDTGRNNQRGLFGIPREHAGISGNEPKSIRESDWDQSMRNQQLGKTESNANERSQKSIEDSGVCEIRTDEQEDWSKMIDAAEHLNLVHHTIRKHHYTPANDMTNEDLFQIGCIGLVKAAEKFDPSRGGKFSTYAVNWIRSEIGRAMVVYTRQKNTAQRPLRLDAKIADTEITLGESITSNDDVEGNVIANETAKRALEMEPVIARMLLKGHNQKEIAKELGMTHQNVSLRVISMRKKLMK